MDKKTKSKKSSKNRKGETPNPTIEVTRRLDRPEDSVEQSTITVGGNGSVMSQKPTECFVIMPFGKKPFNDGSGRFYDFDKVYRVIIARAIRQAGMNPRRADEKNGSNVIHTDMFKDLRDRSVVLADLSLNNPNVFYELGIRHVMSSTGTVLMCHAGSDLPFDVTLSRVVFYSFDGESLDWEEVEAVVRNLQLALEEAKRGTPDSPVHALLQSVHRREETHGRSNKDAEASYQANAQLDSYAQMIAGFWHEEKIKTSELIRQHSHTPFGARSLGYYCLSSESVPPEAEEMAGALKAVEQYDVAVDLYEWLHKSNALSIRGLLNFASSTIDHQLTVETAEKAATLIKESFHRIRQQLGGAEEEATDPRHLEILARCYQRQVDICHKIWSYTGDLEDLAVTLDALTRGLAIMQRARNNGRSFPIGMLAQAHLRYALFLRLQDDNPERVDVERARDAVLSLRPTQHDKDIDRSYLRWFQAITFADCGDEETARRAVLEAYSEDAKIMDRADCGAVGRRQYTYLRRFIEDYASVLRNASLVGHISQVLQIGHR